jgi:hypothetical protein
MTEEGARERLRAERKLEPVDERQEGSPIDLVKNGTYGFTYSPGTEGMPLFRNRLAQGFEVHKTADGALHIVGFLSDAEAAQVDWGEESLEVNLYPEPFEAAQRMVSIPMRRVVKAKPLSRSAGNYLPLQL